MSAPVRAGFDPNAVGREDSVGRVVQGSAQESNSNTATDFDFDDDDDFEYLPSEDDAPDDLLEESDDEEESIAATPKPTNETDEKATPVSISKPRRKIHSTETTRRLSPSRKKARTDSNQEQRQDQSNSSTDDGLIALRTRAKYSLHDKSLDECGADEETLENIMEFYFPDSDEQQRKKQQEREEREYHEFLQSLAPGPSGDTDQATGNVDEDDDDEDYDPSEDAPPLDIMDIRVSRKELEMLMREPIEGLGLPGVDWDATNVSNTGVKWQVDHRLETDCSPTPREQLNGTQVENTSTALQNRRMFEDNSARNNNNAGSAHRTEPKARGTNSEDGQSTKQVGYGLKVSRKNGHPFSKEQYQRLCILLRRHMQQLIQLYFICISNKLHHTDSQHSRWYRSNLLSVAPGSSRGQTTMYSQKQRPLSNSLLPPSGPIDHNNAIPKAADKPHWVTEICQTVYLLSKIGDRVDKAKKRLADDPNWQGGVSTGTTPNVMILPPSAHDVNGQAIPVTRAKLAAMRKRLTPSVFAANGYPDLSDVLQGHFLNRFEKASLPRNNGKTAVEFSLALHKHSEPMKVHYNTIEPVDWIQPSTQRMYGLGRRQFSEAEDELVVLGFQHFTEHDIQAIHADLLPVFTPENIKNRVKNRSSSKCPSNPIKTYRTKMKEKGFSKVACSSTEDSRIRQGVVLFEKNWTAISKYLLPHRGPMFLERRWTYLNKLTGTMQTPTAHIPVKFLVPPSQPSESQQRNLPPTLPMPMLQMQLMMQLAQVQHIGATIPTTFTPTRGRKQKHAKQVMPPPVAIGIPGMVEYPPEMLAAMRNMARNQSRTNYPPYSNQNSTPYANSNRTNRVQFRNQNRTNSTQYRNQHGRTNAPDTLTNSSNYHTFEREELLSSSDDDDDEHVRGEQRTTIDKHQGNVHRPSLEGIRFEKEVLDDSSSDEDEGM